MRPCAACPKPKSDGLHWLPVIYFPHYLLQCFSGIKFERAGKRQTDVNSPSPPPGSVRGRLASQKVNSQSCEKEEAPTQPQMIRNTDGWQNNTLRRLRELFQVCVAHKALWQS